MNRDAKIRKILDRLQEILSEKKPFLMINPLVANESAKFWSVAEFQEYANLCEEEEKLLIELEKLEK